MKKTAAVLLICLVMLWPAALPAAAAEAVPDPVLAARQGVVRVVTMFSDGFGVGTGFCVGTSKTAYVVTNQHVVADGDEVRLYYETGGYVTARVVAENAGRDLCILRPLSPIENLQVLPLQTGDFDTGIAVYALGYPGAADMLSGDWEQYEYDASNLVADRATMTVTDGIISAIRDSQWIGDGSRTVLTVQTNAALSGGNSGGPLLDKDANIVGINSISVTDGTGSAVEGMHAAIHVSELIAELNAAGIDFDGSPAEEPEEAAETETGAFPLWLVLAGVGAVVAIAAVVAVLLVVRRRRKKAAGATLEAFERGNFRVEEVAALEMVSAFVAGLLPLAHYDLGPLMRPDNVLIGADAITLRERGARPGAPVPMVAGYSAPEVYEGAAGPAATVYFVGAMMYTLLTGQRPPDALVRRQANAPVFPVADTLQNLVNQAMEPYQQNRIGDLYQLWDVLQREAPAVFADNHPAAPAR